MARPKIEWKTSPEEGRPTRYPPHIRDVGLSQELKTAMVGKLSPGALWEVKNNMVRRHFAIDVTPHPLPVLETCVFYDHKPDVHRGSIIIYAGLLRLDEEGAKGVIRVPRHTFIAPDVGRVIICDLNAVFPL